MLRLHAVVISFTVVGEKNCRERGIYEGCSESKEHLRIQPRAVVSLYQISHLVCSVECRYLPGVFGAANFFTL